MSIAVAYYGKIQFPVSDHAILIHVLWENL